jgi:hypothetical protein
VQLIRALRQERAPAAKNSAVQIVLRSETKTLSTAKTSRLVAGLVPATIVEQHSDGLQPVSCDAGMLHAEVVIDTRQVSS